MTTEVGSSINLTPLRGFGLPNLARVPRRAPEASVGLDERFQPKECVTEGGREPVAETIRGIRDGPMVKKLLGR